MKEKVRLWARTIRQETCKDLQWLQHKINGMDMTAKMWLLVPSGSKNLLDNRLLLTDQVSLLPAIEDIRALAYYRLAKLWADGLLPRLRRCQNEKCRKFFLGKTKKENPYCSQRCAQSVTAPERVRASRARRAAWTDTRKNLERAVENMRTLRKTTESQALERGEGTLKKAEMAFTAAYPRKKGPGYGEGERLLARAKEQVKRLRKKVKGY
jgi:hypothetical protein